MAIRITHDIIEVLRDGDPNARITHNIIEVLRDGGDPNARITHSIAEVLRSVKASVPAQGTSMFLVFGNYP